MSERSAFAALPHIFYVTIYATIDFTNAYLVDSCFNLQHLVHAPQYVSDTITLVSLFNGGQS